MSTSKKSNLRSSASTNAPKKLVRVSDRQLRYEDTESEDASNYSTSEEEVSQRRRYREAISRRRYADEEESSSADDRYNDETDEDEDDLVEIDDRGRGTAPKIKRNGKVKQVSKSPWVAHVKKFSAIHKIPYGVAMLDAKCKASYHAKKNK